MQGGTRGLGRSWQYDKTGVGKAKAKAKAMGKGLARLPRVTARRMRRWRRMRHSWEVRVQEMF